MASLPNWHPMAVHFPVAIYTTALACDAVLWLGLGRGWLDRLCVLLYGVAAITSGVAAVTGKLAESALADRLSPEVDEAVAVHGDWAFFTVVLFFAVAGMRFDAAWRDRGGGSFSWNRMRWAAMAISIVAFVVLMGTASRGGELVYRFGVGVDERGIIDERR